MKPSIDMDAMAKAMLIELQRQGVEFAEVKPRNLYDEEIHFIVLLHTLEGLNPKYVESVRVSNQVKQRRIELGTVFYYERPWVLNPKANEETRAAVGRYFGRGSTAIMNRNVLKALQVEGGING